MEKKQHGNISTQLPIIIGVVFIGAVAIGAIWFVVNMLSSNTSSVKQQVHQITMLAPPPPPPPPPPEMEKLPEPEPEEEIDISEPEEPMPDMADARISCLCGSLQPGYCRSPHPASRYR